MRPRDRPSTGLPLHGAIDRARCDVGAVVDTHSPDATAWAWDAQPSVPVPAAAAYYGTKRA